MWIYSNNNIISQMDTSICLEYNSETKIIRTNQCDGSENQKWEYDPITHILKIKGKCLSSYVSEPEIYEVWAGKLNDGSYAVLLLNRGSKRSIVEISWKEIGFTEKQAKIRDLWEKRDIGVFNNNYYVFLESHDSQMLKITPIPDEDEDEQTDGKTDDIKDVEKDDEKDDGDKKKKEDDNNNNGNDLTIVIVIVVVVFVVLIGSFIAIICYMKKKKRNEPNTLNIATNWYN